MDFRNPLVCSFIEFSPKSIPRVLCSCVVWFGLMFRYAFAADPIFDLDALCATPLNVRILKTVERDGIVTEEVRFHSETDGEKDVDIFAFFSYPKGASHLPAFVWNPGGLGQANISYTEVPARRGYAVLCIDFPQPGYRSTGDYPINTGLDLGADPKQAPIYHGAVALLKAVTFLESRPEVNRERIGMAGASWGGFFTTLMVGVDPRLKVGSCLYGTGSLQLGNAWWDGASQNGRTPPTPEQKIRWSKTLDPAWRLASRKTPMAWFTTTNDGFYSMPALMKTASMCSGPTHLTLLPNWDHAMPVGAHEDHVYAWLDVYLQGKPAFTKVSPIIVKNEAGTLVAHWDFDGAANSADLIASYGEDGNWRGRFWHRFPAEIQGRHCTAKLPAATLPCYISGAVISPSGIRCSSPIIRVESGQLGVKSSVPCLDYNGCQEWGGFEDNQIEFLVRHNRMGQVRWVPKLSDDAKEGKHSAILEPDRTVLPHILYTADVSHTFSCFMKADMPRTINLQLAGESREFSIGTDWTSISMNLTPANTVMGLIPTSIVIPKDARILIDAVTFRPVLPTAK